MITNNAEEVVEAQPEFTGCFVEGLVTPDPIEITGRTGESAVRSREEGIELTRQEVCDEIDSICQEMQRAIRPIKEGAASLLRGGAGWDAKTRQEFLRFVVAEMDRVSTMVAGLPDCTDNGAGDQSLCRTEFNVLQFFSEGTAGTKQAKPMGVITAGDLRIDLLGCFVTVGGHEVKLTPTEFRLLCYLASSPGRVISNAELLSHLWGPKYQTRKQYLRVFVSQLRRKIEPNPKQPKYILTVSYWGYCFRKQKVESDSV